MDKQFDILRANRVLILKILNNYSIEELNKIPEGFNNNIAWNAAHLVVTQQLLCYKFSDLPMSISDEMISLYMKGTAPKRDMTITELDKIKTLMLDLVDQISIDYKKEIFKTYNTYTTSANVTLNSISDAIQFNNFHEGIHFGYILALKKSI